MAAWVGGRVHPVLIASACRVLSPIIGCAHSSVLSVWHCGCLVHCSPCLLPNKTARLEVGTLVKRSLRTNLTTISKLGLCKRHYIFVRSVDIQPVYLSCWKSSRVEYSSYFLARYAVKCFRIPTQLLHRLWEKGRIQLNGLPFICLKLRGRFVDKQFAEKTFRWQDDSLTRWQDRNSVDKLVHLASCQRNVLSVCLSVCICISIRR